MSDNCRIIKAEVKNEEFILNSKIAGASGSHKSVALQLSFDSTWAGTEKKIYFTDARGVSSVHVILPGEYETAPGVYTVPIPAEPLRFAGEMTVTAKGTEIDSRDLPGTAAAWELTGVHTESLTALSLKGPFTEAESLAATGREVLLTDADGKKKYFKIKSLSTESPYTADVGIELGSSFAAGAKVLSSDRAQRIAVTAQCKLKVMESGLPVDSQTAADPEVALAERLKTLIEAIGNMGAGAIGLSSGEAPTASISKDAGDNFLLTLGIPKGDKGDTGATGAAGAAGAAGVSAYASAVSAGYSGTEAQFNSDLITVGGALLRAGGTMTGNLTLNGKLIIGSANYGTSLPAAGTAGRIFFKRQ